MTLDEFRREMWAYLSEAKAEAMRCKDPMQTYRDLETLYHKFDEDERTMADRVLAEWALSDDGGVRFEALALIEDFGIRSAFPALRELARRLPRSLDPGAPYELKKVERIIAKLDGSSAS